MRLSIRCLIALYAVAGIVAATMILEAWGYWGTLMAGAGDGPSSASLSNLLWIWAMGIGVWIFPVTAFIFMLLGSLGQTKGVVHSIGYWYSLICLLVVATALFIFSFRMPLLKWTGSFTLFIAFLWAVGFRKSKVELESH